MKKLLTVLLAFVLCFSVVGCGGNNNPDEQNADKTIIYVHNYNGGVGTQWLTGAKARFEQAYKEKVYEEGKKGVFIDVEANQEERLSSMATSGIHMYFFEQHYDIRNLSQTAGKLLKLTDVITEKDANGVSIESKISAENRVALKGADGEYYGLPHYSWYPGLSYDVELFDKYNLYFADSSESNVNAIQTKFGNANLVANATAKKSCGVDGVYDTADDGLPTSLEEFLILCGYMKTTYSIQPITMSGMYKYYSTYLVEGLWASLAGYDQMKAIYTYQGNVDVVDGFTNENLFTGIDYVKKPNVKTVPVTEKTGYVVYDSVYRYYATAIIEILHKEGFLSDDSKTSTVSHTTAQGNFIMNGKGANKRMAMIIEGSYWFNESEEKANNLSDYFAINPDKTSRNIQWLSLPTTLKGSASPVATGAPARKNTVVETGASYLVVNGNIEGKTGLINAIKDFIKFLYSDAELQNFTISSSTLKAMFNYEVADEEIAKLDDFRKSVLNFAKNNDIVYATAENKTFIKNGNDSFKIRVNAPIFRPIVNNVNYESYYQAIETNKVTAQQAFEATQIGAQGWSAYYVE